MLGPNPINVRLAPWKKYDHRVSANAKEIVVEIRLEGHDHCYTCDCRVRDAKAALKAKGIKFGCKAANHGIFLVISQPEKAVKTPKAICSYLSEILGLEFVPA